MKLLITQAFSLTGVQRIKLEEQHILYYIEDGKPFQELKIDFRPEEIEGIVCNYFFVYNDISLFPNLKFIQLTSVGLDRIPLCKIKERGIRVCTAEDAYAVPMAEWAVCKLLEIYKYSTFFNKNKVEKTWVKNRNIRELSGRTIAIIGFGNVGRNIAKRLKGFDVFIFSVDICEDKSGLSDQFLCVKDIEAALRKADVIFLTLPITEETYHIIDAKMLGIMKNDAVLINVSRGQLIDEDALIEYLDEGKFLGLALDVFENEPLCTGSKMWDYERVIISPHNSFVGNGNQERLFTILIKNLDK